MKKFLALGIVCIGGALGLFALGKPHDTPTQKRFEFDTIYPCHATCAISIRADQLGAFKGWCPGPYAPCSVSVRYQFDGSSGGDAVLTNVDLDGNEATFEVPAASIQPEQLGSAGTLTKKG